MTTRCEWCDAVRGADSMRHCPNHWKSAGPGLGVCEGCGQAIGPKVSITHDNRHLCPQCAQREGEVSA